MAGLTVAATGASFKGIFTGVLVEAPLQVLVTVIGKVPATGKSPLIVSEVELTKVTAQATPPTWTVDDIVKNPPFRLRV